MTVATLRKWGRALPLWLSLPKKVLVVLAPAAGRYSLRQLEKEQRAVERALGRARTDRDWLDSPACGRERI